MPHGRYALLLLSGALVARGQEAPCAGPLSEAQVTSLVTAHAADATVQSLVSRCGIGFTPDASLQKRLKEAGASTGLLAVLSVLAPPRPAENWPWIDQRSGLAWPARDNGAPISRNEAIAYCKTLRAGGHDDWRLPTSAELHTRYDPGTTRPLEDGSATHRFSGEVTLTRAWLWTSNSTKAGEPYAFGFSADAVGGTRFTVLEPTPLVRALCVRNALTPPGPPGPPDVPKETAVRRVTIEEHVFPMHNGILRTSAEGVTYEAKKGKGSFTCAANTISFLYEHWSTLDVNCNGDHIVELPQRGMHSFEPVIDAIYDVMRAAGAFANITSISIPASHIHGIGATTCSGQLTITSTSITFASANNPDHSFNWPTTGTIAAADPEVLIGHHHLNLGRPGEKNNSLQIDPAYSHDFTPTAFRVLWGKPTSKERDFWNWKPLQ